ncbi:hypothetical protein OPQ81_011689 [Rhizoctonia solani]|nr:hypothetical protein OPQ81_011689 [Rhizoctonia solani]
MIELNTPPKYTWRPAHYNKSAPFVYSDENTKHLFELLSARLGQRIVDMGCGTVKPCSRQPRKTESRTWSAVTYRTLSCPTISMNLTGTFDAVFTNSTLQWCKQDPHGPVRAAKALLKPGGRFVGEFPGYMTGIGTRCAFSQVLKRRGITPPDPWFLPQPTEYEKILESEGFRVEHISLNSRVCRLPGPMTDFLRAIYRIAFLKDMEDQEAEEVLQEVSDMCELEHKDGMGNWSIMHTTVRFRAIAPE